MLTNVRVGPNDFCIDLGPGDWRVVIVAAQRFGARGKGFHLNPGSVRLSEHRAHRADVADPGVRYDYSGRVKSDSIEGEVVISDDQMRLR